MFTDLKRVAMVHMFCLCCRVGRTGRAGNKGTAITFIGPDEDRYAPDLVKALKESGAVVPQDLLVRVGWGFYA
jgi:superfamily II DNA/RNA helicase